MRPLSRPHQVRLGQGRRLVFIYYIYTPKSTTKSPIAKAQSFMYLRGALLSSARSDFEV